MADDDLHSNLTCALDLEAARRTALYELLDQAVRFTGGEYTVAELDREPTWTKDLRLAAVAFVRAQPMGDEGHIVRSFCNHLIDRILSEK